MDLFPDDTKPTRTSPLAQELCYFVQVCGKVRADLVSPTSLSGAWRSGSDRDKCKPGISSTALGSTVQSFPSGRTASYFSPHPTVSSTVLLQTPTWWSPTRQMAQYFHFARVAGSGARSV